MSVAVVRTGAANLASVQAAFARLGEPVEIVETSAQIEAARRLVLPGVGAFGAAMARLEAAGLVGALQARVAAGRPTLAICLGLQLLFEGSEESPGVAGLGAIPGTVERFVAPRVPQLGWNAVAGAGGLVEPGYAYFANSYRAAQAPPGWATSTADYCGPFVAAAQRGPVLACQFHPELSGPWGAALLRRWLEVSC